MEDLSKERIQEIADRLSIEIEFDSERPGIHFDDETVMTFEEALSCLFFKEGEE